MNVRTPTPTGSARHASAHPADSPAHQPAVEAVCERVGFDRYVVSHDRPVGYIDVVPPLFVCYLGHPYPRSVEVAQVYDFERAVSIVDAMAAGTRNHTVAG